MLGVSFLSRIVIFSSEFRLMQPSSCCCDSQARQSLEHTAFFLWGGTGFILRKSPDILDLLLHRTGSAGVCRGSVQEAVERGGGHFISGMQGGRGEPFRFGQLFLQSFFGGGGSSPAASLCILGHFLVHPYASSSFGWF